MHDSLIFGQVAAGLGTDRRQPSSCVASQLCTLSKVKIKLAVVLVLVVMYNIPEYARSRVIYHTWNKGTKYLFGRYGCNHFRDSTMSTTKY